LSTVNKHETHSTQTPFFNVNYINCVSHILLLHCTNLLTHVDITHTCHFAKIFRLFSMGKKKMFIFRRWTSTWHTISGMPNVFKSH